MYKCKYFIIQELVPKEIYDKYKDNCWLLFDDRILKTIDALREFVGMPVTINNWHIGGNRSQCGYRTDESTGAVLSMHKRGFAVDCIISKYKGVNGYNNLRDEIKKNVKIFPYIRGMETNINWLHLDTGNRGDKIIEFNP